VDIKNDEFYCFFVLRSVKRDTNKERPPMIWQREDLEDAPHSGNFF
jgi:hypothetical protein